MSKTITKPTDSHSWGLFLTAHAVLVERIEALLADAGLPPLAWYDALWALERAHEGQLRMHELAHHMVISRSNLTRLLDKLEEAGLATRERSSEDRRGAHAVITAQGRKLRKQMWTVYGKAIDEYFNQHLSAHERQVIAQVMLKLISASRRAQG
jgi:DNA-binding MarR family transcriptional regulator